MLLLIIAICSLFIHSTHTAPQSCRDFSTSLNYIDYYIDDTYYGYVFSVDVCLGNLFGTACTDGFTDEFADIICREQGFEGRVDKSFLTITIIITFHK